PEPTAAGLRERLLRAVRDLPSDDAPVPPPTAGEPGAPDAECLPVEDVRRDTTADTDGERFESATWGIPVDVVPAGSETVGHVEGGRDGRAPAVASALWLLAVLPVVVPGSSDRPPGPRVKLHAMPAWPR